MDILKVITDWPVIFQGVLASALFWLIIEVGQKIARQISNRFNENTEAPNWNAFAAFEAKSEIAEKAKFICIYATLHYSLKAIIVSIISFAIAQFIETFSIIGYVISVYYLFRALAFVPHTSMFGPPEGRNKRFIDSTKSFIEKNRRSKN
jgi:hypothetical protein